MNNLLSYCGLGDAKIRASDKDLPVNGRKLELVSKEINHLAAILHVYAGV